MKEKEVRNPYDCPFVKYDYDGYLDGCSLDNEVKCYDCHNQGFKTNFPEGCPLENNNIVVKRTDVK